MTRRTPLARQRFEARHNLPAINGKEYNALARINQGIPVKQSMRIRLCSKGLLLSTKPRMGLSYAGYKLLERGLQRPSQPPAKDDKRRALLRRVREQFGLPGEVYSPQLEHSRKGCWG